MQKLTLQKSTLTIFLSIVIQLACGMNATDKIINDPRLLYQMPLPDNSLLNKKVTVSWRFISFNEFIVTLQKTYALNSKVISSASTIATPVLVNITNGTLNDLINQASLKFGYNWSYHNNLLLFSAITPVLHPVESQLNIIPTQFNTKVWVLKPSDRTLRNVLTTWCKSSGWQLVWNVKADYPITTSWSIEGSFEYAVNEILKASQITDTPLSATMHDSNRVLEVFTPTNSK